MFVTYSNVLVGTLLGNCYCYSYSMGTVLLDSIDSDLAIISFPNMQMSGKIWLERFPFLCVFCVLQVKCTLP
jgi:hypothetical protein